MRRRKTFRDHDSKTNGHEALTLQTAIEVASVKAQVQHIVRNLRATLDELEGEVAKLPGEGNVGQDGGDTDG